MYVYIFEDGTTQKHEHKPTTEDCRAIADGLLMVLHSESDICLVDENLKECELEVCELFDDQITQCHSPL